MFSGIVTHQGVVSVNATLDADAHASGQESDFAVLAPAAFCADLKVGASVACNGCCLTLKQAPQPVEDKQADSTNAEANMLLQFGLSPETLMRTTLGDLSVGAPLNLERALRYGDEIGGHLVSGHVDSVATLIAIEDLGENRTLTFAIGTEFASALAPKGGVTLDGVALTINTRTPDPQHTDRVCFSVMLIAHTLSITTLGALRPQGQVNLEIDPAARYSSGMATSKNS